MIAIAAPSFALARARPFLLACLAFVFHVWAGPALAALSAAPSSATLASGTYTTIVVSDVRSQLRATSSDTDVATVTASATASRSATVTIRGRSVGKATIRLRDGESDSRRLDVPVTVTAASTLRVSPTSIAASAGATTTIVVSNASGAISASSANTRVATANVSAGLVSVRAVAAGATVVTIKDNRASVNVPVTVLGTTPGPVTGKFSLLAWNDLGMHCMDGKDYSVFSILPPYNNLHAQLVNASTGKQVTAGVTLTYESVADPTGSINTTSAGKTNFWTWAKSLYGATLAPDMGLTGHPTPSTTPSPMVLDAANGWFEASGVPITPYDDAGAKNFYPTVKVTARDATGAVLATTTTVLPVSDEITCAACHTSRTAAQGNAAQQAARPAAGWVFDPNLENDWKRNILRLHDEKQAANPAYKPALAAAGLLATGLFDSAMNGKPTLCASCHGSNALPGTGQAGISSLTSALHTNHAKAVDPATSQTLDASANRSSCYLCHPGSVTKCLRGAMGNAADAQGNAVMGCQSCHGNMTKVGDPKRAGWLHEPNCQSCHYDGKRFTNALDAAGNLVAPADTRFATNANTPVAGSSLFRFSKGHGGLQCEACHGATHAEYPSSHDNDNLQSIALQGYKGTIGECTVCHSSMPSTTSGGPHGMHSIGASWVSRHGDQVESGGRAACAYCHGPDFRGSPLSKVKANRSFAVEGRTRTYAAGQQVGCYDCHNGPNP